MTTFQLTVTEQDDCFRAVISNDEKHKAAFSPLDQGRKAAAWSLHDMVLIAAKQRAYTAAHGLRECPDSKCKGFGLVHKGHDGNCVNPECIKAFHDRNSMEVEFDVRGDLPAEFEPFLPVLSPV